jgi:hypothetical protein
MDLRLANVSIRPDFTLGGGGEAGEVWLSEEPSLTSEGGNSSSAALE